MYSIFLLQESSKNKFFFIIKPAPPYFVPPANKQHHPFQAGLTRQINVKPMILSSNPPRRTADRLTCKRSKVGDQPTMTRISSFKPCSGL